MVLNRELKYQAVVKFPKLFLGDFDNSLRDDISFTDCYLNIHIPYISGIFSFTISSYIAIEHNPIYVELTPVLYSIDKSSGSKLQTAMNYCEDLNGQWCSHEILLKKLNNNTNSKSPKTILLEKSISTISLVDFLKDTKNSFKKYLTDTFNDDFALIDFNGDKIKTKLADNFIKDSFLLFSKQINLISKMLDPKTIEIDSYILSPYTFQSIKTISKELDSFLFMSSLETSLSRSTLNNNKPTKI